MSPASSLGRKRRRAVPVDVAGAKVAVAEIAEIAETVATEDVGRIKVATRISRMTMIAKLASWVPVRAKRSDKVVDARHVVVATVEIVESVESVAVIANVVMVGAKSAVTAVIVASRASVEIVRSVRQSLVSVNNVSLSLSTKRLAST
jgi:hypothetical protein